MIIVKFGAGSEYVKIEFPSSYSEEGWAQVSVEIKVNCFHGIIEPWFDAADIELFTLSLRKLYESLGGEADFIPLEKQLILKFVCKASGHISVTGVAWSQASYENKLEFSFELDQSYLQEPLIALDRLVKQTKQACK